MSDRLTNKWTGTLDEAFGATGTKGRHGEEFLLKVFASWGWSAIHYEDDYQKQVDGIDIEFRNPNWANYYSCDVKNNMNEYGSFYVYRDWLFKVKSDRIFHVNPNTGWLAWYGVSEMRDVYNRSREYITITPAKSPTFVKRSKANV